MPLLDTITVSVADIYGAPLTNLSSALQRRQQFAEFRTVRPGEKFLALDRTVKAHTNESYRFGGPRLVIATTPLRRMTFVETGEVRTPMMGEWYMDNEGYIAQGRAGAVYSAPYAIVERQVVEVPA